MTRHERVRYEMLLRIRDFGAAHREQFPESSSGSQAFATVAEAVADVEAHATAKLVKVREGQRDRAARRSIMLSRMRTIARTSRGIRTASGAILTLQMPRRRSDVAVITAARAFLREAEAHHDRLVVLGLPTTCLAELREATEAFAASMAERRAGRSGVAGAQAGITAAIARGTDAAHTLDIVVLNTLGHDPVAFATWQRDRRVVEGKGRSPSTGGGLPAAAEPRGDGPAATEAATSAETSADPLRKAS